MESGTRRQRNVGVAGLTGYGGVSLPPGGAKLYEGAPGGFNIDVSDPVGSALRNQQSSDDWVNGLGQAIAGKDNNSILGGIPIVGDVLRGVSEIPGVGIPAALAGHAAGMGVSAAVGVLSNIPTGWVPGVGSDEVFNALPHTPEWEMTNEAANQDFFGGGNKKFDYAKAYWADLERQASLTETGTLRTLSPGLMAGAGGSLGGMIGQALDIFQLPQRIIERGIAGTAKWASGENRVQETLHHAAVGNELTPVEQMVVSKIGSGEWTEERALDFMASHGAGLSRNELLQIVGSFATDPTVLASLGTVGLGRAGVVGARLVSQGIKPATFAQRAGINIAAAQAGQLGKTFKVARTIIDPLSAIGNSRYGPAAVDLWTSDVASKTFHFAQVADGGTNAYRVARDMGLDVEAMYSAAAGRGASYARRILGKMKAAFMVNDQKALSLMSPTEAANIMAEKTPKWVLQSMRDMVYRNRQTLWTTPESKANLAQRLATAFPGESAVDVDVLTAQLGKMNDSELGLFHDILYAGETKMLRNALAKGKLEYQGKTPYERLNMMDHTTLTDLGAAGFLKRIGAKNSEADEALEAMKAAFPTAAKRNSVKGKAAQAAYEAKYPVMKVDSPEALAELAELQRLFPEATVRYGVDVQFAIDDLTRKLAGGTEGSLPHQVIGAEMDEMPKQVRDFFLDHPDRTLGFRPPHGEEWNFQSNPVTGQLDIVGDPWVEDVLEGVVYRPGFQLPFNVAGQVLPVRAAVKALDWLEAGPRLMNTRISGAMRQANAEQRFIKAAIKGGHGVTEQAARKVFRALSDHANLIEHPTVSSLSKKDINKVAKLALQDMAVGHGLTSRDFLRWVVEGFEGDLSIVGLSQKIPNKLRTMSAELTGSNFMYEISQQTYGQLKFRGPLAIKFKIQESIEPYALNWMEGTNMQRVASQMANEMAATLKVMRDTGLTSQLDQTDLMEQKPWALNSEALPSDDDNWFRKLFNPRIADSKFRAQTEMLSARLGTAVRAKFEEAGKLDDYLEFQKAYAQSVGRAVSDSEFAQYWVNSVHSKVRYLGPDGMRLDVEALIDEANTWTEVGTGRVQVLALDLVATKLDGLNGNRIEDLKGLIEAMTPRANVPVSQLIKEADIRRHLAVYAPPQYVDRFIRAINFNYGDFISETALKYKMSPVEVRNIEEFIRGVAHGQGMTPVELLSQVVARGESSVVGALKVLRGENKTGGALIEEMSDLFRDFLHPSGVETLDAAMGSVPKTAQEIAAREALEKFGDDVGARNMYEYDLEFPPETREVFIINDVGKRTGEPLILTTSGIGENFRNMDPVLRDPLLKALATFRREFPEIPLGVVDSIDIFKMYGDVGVPLPPGTLAVTIGTNADEGSIMFNNRMMGLDWDVQWRKMGDKGPEMRARTQFNQDIFGMKFMMDRLSNLGADYITDRTPVGTLLHELGHVLDEFMLGKGAIKEGATAADQAAFAAKYQKYKDFMESYVEGPGARMTSEYGAGPNHAEAMAELLGVALNKNADLAKFAIDAPPPGPLGPLPKEVPQLDPATLATRKQVRDGQIRTFVERVKREYPEPDVEYILDQVLEEWNLGNLDGLKVYLGDLNAKIRDLEGYGPGGVTAAKMTGPQTTEEAATELRQILKDVGVWKPVEPSLGGGASSAFSERVIARSMSGLEDADPNLENAYRYFADWIRASANPLNHPEAIDMVKGIPSGGVPYNHTENALIESVYSRIREMENDTYRLQFYGRERPLWERSLNHPVFGLYPASYMWVKIMPQVVKFIAKQPFGLKTGALAYALADIQKDVMIQNEFDPEFRKMIEGVGSNKLLWFLSLMLPATPWDIPSNWPMWSRELAEQGLNNQNRALKGQPTKGLDFGRVASKLTDPLSAELTTGQKSATSAVSALGDFMFGSKKEQKATPGRVGLTSAVAPAAQQLAEPLSDAQSRLSEILGG